MKNKKFCRIERITEKKLKLLYKDFPKCKDCKFGCLGEFQGIECLNKEVDYTLNDIIKLLNEDKIDLKLFAEKSGLKFEFLMDYLKGKSVMKYSYYSKLIEKLESKDIDIFENYKERFKNESENNTSLEMAGGNING